MTVPYRPNGLQWPLTAQQLQGLDDTINDIYRRLRQVVLSEIALTGDVTGTGVVGGIVTAIAPGVIVDADINAAAAINVSKLVGTTVGQVLISNGAGVAPVWSANPTLAIGATGSSRFLQATLAGNGAVGHYNFNVGSTPNAHSARNDHVLCIGYNIGNGGGRVDLTEPAFAFRIEDFYTPTVGQQWMEAHWEFYDPAGTLYRPIAWQAQRTTGGYLTDESVAITSNAFSYIGIAGTQYVKFTPASLKILNSTSVDISTNNVQSLKQAKVSGSLRNLVYINGSDQTVVGDTTTVLETVLSGIYTSIYKNAIAVTSTDAFVLQNATAATAAIPVQQAPRLRFRGNVWNTTAVAANNTDDWWIESVPASAAVPTGELRFISSTNGGAGVTRLTLNTLNTPSVPSNFTVTATLTAGLLTTAAIRSGAGANSNISLDAAGLFKLQHGTGPVGVGLDVATDAILKLRTRAQTGGAALDLLEQTAPAAGAANTVRIFSQDNGAGKTQLMAIFNSGVAQQIAIEP